MDQAETFAGLAAAVDLAEALGDPPTVARARRGLERMRSGVEMLWNPAAGSYDWALHANGFRETTKWPVLYPDALQQVWTVAFGLSRGDRARRIMERFGREQPNWSQPATTARFGPGPDRTGYWAPAGWAFLQTGASPQGRSAAASIRAASLATGRLWPFTSGDAGQLILLESGDTGYLARATTPPPPPVATPSPPASLFFQLRRGGPIPGTIHRLLYLAGNRHRRFKRFWILFEWQTCLLRRNRGRRQ